MRQLEKSLKSASAGWGKSRILSFSILLVLITVISLLAQKEDYWANAPAGKIKIFTISFVDAQNGSAKSAEGDELATTDGGIHWTADKQINLTNENFSSQLFWKADIYCSIMKTTDGGLTWFPYEDSKQEHFCGVYLKDANTGYQVASEFLNKVTNKIIAYSVNNKLDSLVDHPNKCTEYYRNADEGWSLGWCIKDYKQITNR